jgi:hypothetical protein
MNHTNILVYFKLNIAVHQTGKILMFTLTVLDYVIEELVLDTRAGKKCLKPPQMFTKH